MFRIGTVPYHVAEPLTKGLVDNKNVELHIAPPSELAQLLKEDKVDCALASSILCLNQSEYFFWADGPVIASIGKIRSVLLMLNPKCNSIEDVKVWAADPHSKTGRELAKIVLEKNNVDARMVEVKDGIKFNDELDAIQIIGDPALNALREKPQWQAIDLGEEWQKITNLPFIFAGWIFKDAEKFKEIAPLLEIGDYEIHNDYRESGLSYKLDASQVELGLQKFAEWISS
jgi:chorismate dehydratase